MLKPLQCTLSIVGLIAVMLLASCADEPYFQETRWFNPPEWSAQSPEVFTFQVEDTTRAFDFILNLRHSDNYPYSNLYLFVQLDFPNGKKSIDTLECILADPRGRWNGKKTGQYVDHRIAINRRRIFPLTGTYHMRISQAMRVDPLPEVYDLGFILDYYEAP